MSNDYPSDWDNRRKRVYKRDSYQCQNCGRPGGPEGSAELHAHHVVPKDKDGSHELSNLITLCKKCHKKTDSYPVKEHTGSPHTWPGPDWDSDKGLSNQKERGGHSHTSAPDTSGESDTETWEDITSLYKEGIPQEHFKDYASNYSLEDSAKGKRVQISTEKESGQDLIFAKEDVIRYLYAVVLIILALFIISLVL